MTEKPSIVTALAAVMEDVRAVKKADRNGQQGYNFRGIDAVMNAAGPALRRHGVVVVPMLEEVHYRDVQTSTGKASRECTVQVRYRFHGPAGDHLDCVTPGESMDFGDKGAPKAMSVAFRIALLQALCLPTDDTDSDAESFERVAAKPPQQRQGSGQNPAEKAKAHLRELVVARGLDGKAVAARFEEQYGEPLKQATDPTRVQAFTKLIEGEKAPEPAGAQ